MARKVNIELTDDLNPELSADETVEFSIDGVAYEIDLNSANSAKMRESLSVWIDAARKMSGRNRGRRPITAGSTIDRAEATRIRAWANRQGVPVASRGRIPADLINQYYLSEKSTSKVAAVVARAEAKVAEKEATQ